MPVVLAREDYARWLDLAAPDPTEPLRPYAADEMRAYPVSSRVGSPKNDDATLIDRIDVLEPRPGSPPGVDEN
jgi:putative SOS response-associated peptidase YedK